MEDGTYSTYEAKAKFSEIIRKVREGSSVTVSYHGKPVAEIRPIGEPGGGIEDRLKALEASGVVIRARGERPKVEPMVRKPGALKRFLKDRNA